MEKCKYEIKKNIKKNYKKMERKKNNDVDADVAQHECSKIKYYASTLTKKINKT